METPMKRLDLGLSAIKDLIQTQSSFEEVNRQAASALISSLMHMIFVDEKTEKVVEVEAASMHEANSTEVSE